MRAIDELIEAMKRPREVNPSPELVEALYKASDDEIEAALRVIGYGLPGRPRKAA